MDFQWCFSLKNLASTQARVNATPERYNKAAADLAWQRTIAWFNKYVRG
jgi:dienelactone hydrolase